jgi:hypothetical protein
MRAEGVRGRADRPGLDAGPEVEVLGLRDPALLPDREVPLREDPEGDGGMKPSILAAWVGVLLLGLLTLVLGWLAGMEILSWL